MFALMALSMLMAEPPATAKQFNSYVWKPTDNVEVVELLRDGKLIGQFNVRDRVYRQCDDSGCCTKVRTPPIDPPAVGHAVDESDGIKMCPNYGIDLDKINRERSYSVNGKNVSSEEAASRMAAKLIDDSARMFLTVIGTDADCEQVRADLASSPALADVKNRVHLHCYHPDDPMVKCGFKTDGKPTVYCQSPDGKVLHRQDGYDGPEKLAEAVRKADPKYKAEADPNLNDPMNNLKTVPQGAWLVAGGIILMLAYMHRDKNQPANA